MARKNGKKRLTLSEHLALHAQLAERDRAREEARASALQALRELDTQVRCTCPACVRLRQMQEKNQSMRNSLDGSLGA